MTVVRRLTRLAPIVVLTIAVGIAPWFTPHDARRPVVFPYDPPQRDALLGGDQIGRDVLSRFLSGGRELLLLALLIAVLVTAVSAVVGSAAALYRRLGALIEWSADVLILVPPTLGVLVVMLSVPKLGAAGVVVVSMAFGAPYCTRIFATAATQVAATGYVEAATGYGDHAASLIFREILPNLRPTMAAQCGIRFVHAVYVVGAAAFLNLPGFSGSNWAVMVRDAAGPGMVLNPWSVIAPTAGIAVLTLGMWLSITLALPSTALNEQ